MATVRIPTPKLPPLLRGSAPKLNGQQGAQQIDPEDDIPKAVPPDKKPQKP